MNSQVITVGVDGSRSSSGALRFALAEARLRGASVHAVTVWQADTVYAGYGGILLQEESAAHEKAATELQDKAIQVVPRETPAPPIERRVVRGHPGIELMELSRDAALFVRHRAQTPGQARHGGIDQRLPRPVLQGPGHGGALRRPGAAWTLGLRPSLGRTLGG
jgi:nucleotide-binding universal stress UspA family protein